MKLCSKCGTWHLQSPIPERCNSCGAKLTSVRTMPPAGDQIIGLPASEVSDAGLGTHTIPGSIRTRVKTIDRAP